MCIVTISSRCDITNVPEKWYDSNRKYLISKGYSLHKEISESDMRKAYYKRVRAIVETNNLATLKHYNNRSFRGYNLGYIYPRFIGYKNNIPPELIGDIRNLRFVLNSVNMRKGSKIDKIPKHIKKYLDYQEQFKYQLRLIFPDDTLTE